MKEKGLKKICTLYQDDDFGLEVMRGGEIGLKDLGTDFVERTTYKRGATGSNISRAPLSGKRCPTLASR